MNKQLTFCLAFLLIALLFPIEKLSAQKTKQEKERIAIAEDLTQRFNESKIEELVNDLFNIEDPKGFIGKINPVRFQFGRITKLENFAFEGKKTLTASAYFENMADMEMLMSFFFEEKTNKMTGWVFKPAPPKIAYPEITDATTIDDLGNAFAAYDESMALSIGIYNNGTISFYNYGKVSADNTDKPTENSLYEIGSISKTFTALCLAQMVREGKVKLDDPLSKYLPKDIPPIKKEGIEVTLRDLSTHHSGFDRLAANSSEAPFDKNDPYKDYGIEKLNKYLTSVQLKTKPRTSFEYSNFAVGLLGHILAELDGKSYEEMIQSRITNQLKMPNTSINNTGELNDQLLPGHTSKTIVPYWTWANSTMTGAGGIVSSTSDMTQYLQALIRGNNNELDVPIFLTQQIFQEFDDKKSIGLGWMHNRMESTTTSYHNGATPGFTSYCGYVKRKRVGVIVLNNSSVNVDELGQKLLQLINKEDIKE